MLNPAQRLRRRLASRAKSVATASIAGTLLLPLLAVASPAQADDHTSTHRAVHQAAGPCVRHGQANYPVEYYWKNIAGWRLGNGNISVTTSPSLRGGQIAPGSTFTLTLRHQTAKWPFVVTSYTTT
ncbi:hypothetical protein ACWEJ6_42265 [Nonomuraea sp. NPDC004702]